MIAKKRGRIDSPPDRGIWGKNPTEDKKTKLVGVGAGRGSKTQVKPIKTVKEKQGGGWLVENMVCGVNSWPRLAVP